MSSEESGFLVLGTDFGCICIWRAKRNVMSQNALDNNSFEGKKKTYLQWSVGSSENLGPDIMDALEALMTQMLIL